MQLRLKVNGQVHTVTIAAGTRLIDVLRSRLGLTGTKQACRAGECGACTVLVEGKPIQACVMLAAKARDADIWTVEGLSEEWLELKRAFAEEGGFQCGFCTPGQIMHAVAILTSATPEMIGDEEWLRGQMTGNVCRCTGYSGIIRALQRGEVRSLAHRVAGTEAVGARLRSSSREAANHAETSMNNSRGRN